VVAVKKSLEAIEGVVSADVTLSPPRAVITCDLSRVAVDRLTAATGEEGYPSTAEAP
jgi:copper chaperone CopZ